MRYVWAGLAAVATFMVLAVAFAESTANTTVSFAGGLAILFLAPPGAYLVFREVLRRQPVKVKPSLGVSEQDQRAGAENSKRLQATAQQAENMKQREERLAALEQARRERVEARARERAERSATRERRRLESAAKRAEAIALTKQREERDTESRQKWTPPGHALSLVYLGGHPDLSQTGPARIWSDGHSLKVRGYGRFLTIPLDQIVSCTLERASKRSIGGGVAWTVAGTALLGPVGMALGVIHGFGARDASVIRLTVALNGRRFDAYFGGTNVLGIYPKFAAELRS
ncbi:MAG: hypothetical protein ACYC41_06455 [Bacillota bacterium]